MAAAAAAAAAGGGAAVPVRYASYNLAEEVGDDGGGGVASREPSTAAAGGSSSGTSVAREPSTGDGGGGVLGIGSLLGAAAAESTAAVVSGGAGASINVSLEWHGGNFFDHYVVQRTCKGEKDELRLYGQGTYGTVVGCNAVEAVDTYDGSGSSGGSSGGCGDLVVKVITVKRGESETKLFEREVSAAMQLHKALAGSGTTHLLFRIEAGYMSTDTLTKEHRLYVVMRPLPGVEPLPYLVPRHAFRGYPQQLDCGGTLASQRLESLFEQLMALKQLLAVLEAMARLEPPMLHRDIKPGNVFLMGRKTAPDGREYPHVQLADFTSLRKHDADESDPQRALTTEVGTRECWSPELARGSPYGTEADVFAAGVVLYHMVTGYLPLEDHDLLAAFPSAKLADDNAAATEYVLRRFALGTGAATAPFRDGESGGMSELGNLIFSLLYPDPAARLDATAALELPILASLPDVWEDDTV